MTPKQLQRKIEVLTRRFDRLRGSLSDYEAEVRYLKEIVEAAIAPTDVDETEE